MSRRWFGKCQAVTGSRTDSLVARAGRRARWSGLTALMLAAGTAGAAEAQTKPPGSFQPPPNYPPDVYVSTSPAPDTSSSGVWRYSMPAVNGTGPLDVHIGGCDTNAINVASLAVTINGQPVTRPDSVGPYPGSCTRSVLYRPIRVQLAPGSNQLTVTLCDALGACRDRSIFAEYSASGPAPTISAMEWRTWTEISHVNPRGTTPVPASNQLTVSGADFWFHVAFADPTNIAGTQRTVTLNGAPASLAHTVASSSTGGGIAHAEGTLKLASGTNTIVTRACSAAGVCVQRTLTVVSDQTAPVVAVTPADGLNATLVDQSVTVDWSDVGTLLDTASRRVTLNDADVTGRMTHSAGRSSGVLGLVPGTNVVEARICDRRVGLGEPNCTVRRATYHYALGARVAPIISLSPHQEEVLRPRAFDAQLSYSTIPYFSLDQPVSATLSYRSSHAAPMGMVQVDVVEASAQTPTALSISLVDGSGGRPVLSTGSFESFFTAGPGPNRLALQFDAAHLQTGAYAYNVVVRSHWSDGSTLESVVPTVVLIRNERGSPFGAGWSLDGFQRIHAQGNDLVLADGDGSLLYFRGTSCWTHVDGTKVCDFRSPAGEPSTVSRYENVYGSYYARYYPDRSATVFHATGVVSYHQSALGLKHVYHTNGSTRPASMVPPGNRSITFNYDPGSGKILSIQDGMGRTTGFAVDRFGHLGRVIDPDGHRGLNVVYDTATGRAGAVVPRQGQAWYLLYDHAFEVSRINSPAIPTRIGSVRQSALMRTLSSMVIPAPGSGGTLATRAPRVAPENLWLRVRRGNAPDSTSFQVDRFGLVTAMRDTAGGVTRILRDAHGRDTLTISPIQTVATRWASRWADDRVVERRIGTKSTTYEYHPQFGELTRIVGSSGHPSYQAWFNSRGLADSVRVREGGTTRFTYDADGQVQTVRDDSGDEVRYTYEAGSSYTTNTRSITRNGVGVTFTRDIHGRITQQTSTLGPSIQTQWSAVNEPVQITGPVGDAARPTFLAGRLATLTDPNGQRHEFQRNALGLETARVDPRGRAALLAYDLLARVDSTVNRRGQVTRFEYDAKGRPTAVRASDGSYVLYSHDDLARTTVIRTAHSTDSVHYSERGLAEREVSVRGARRYVTTRMRHMTYAHMSTGVVSFVLPLVQETTDGPGGSRVDQLLLDGRLLRRDDTQISRDSRGRITAAGPHTHGVIWPRVTMEHGPHGISKITYPRIDNTFRYHRDAAGRITGMRVSGDTVPRFANDSSAFLYDAADRLTGYGRTSGGSFAWHSTYSYDGGGNRTDRGSVIESGNRLAGHDGWQLFYDDDGNLIRRYKAGVLDQTLTWNAFGQLTAVTTVGAGTVTFQYDGMGRRIRKTGPQGSTDYVYDGSDMVAEANAATGNVSAAYTYLPGIDLPYEVTRHDGGEPVHGQYVIDHQGSVLGIVSYGALVNEYRYDPWGRTEVVKEGMKNPLRFAGREFDTETGLYYLRARYYDPLVGRFISEDPSHLAGGLNLYAYAANNPIAFRDPSGLSPCPTTPYKMSWTEYAMLSEEDQRKADSDKCIEVERYLLNEVFVRANDHRRDPCMTPTTATIHLCSRSQFFGPSLDALERWTRLPNEQIGPIRAAAPWRAQHSFGLAEMVDSCRREPPRGGERVYACLAAENWRARVEAFGWERGPRPCATWVSTFAEGLSPGSYVEGVAVGTTAGAIVGAASTGGPGVVPGAVGGAATGAVGTPLAAAYKATFRRPTTPCSTGGLTGF